MIKAIIFDFDGTIIDTETAWYAAFKEAYREYGVDLTLEMYSQCIGTSLHQFNPYEYLMTDLKLPIDREEFRKSVQQRHSLLMEKEEIRPGVVRYLNEAKAAGLKIGLASSSVRAWVEKYLERLKLKPYFECIRTADDVRRVKPDPELYVQATAALGVQPNEAVAIEDSPNGAKAAEAAGLHCLYIPNTITASLPFEPRGGRLSSLLDLELKDLIVNPIGR
ncbi:HAD family hydrolase [Paenibacillus turpanensis]|uniref:HAD family hydrolase n=1 Tax=Paenibacillus turpanensis TaxID=2689078 RepID=UPI00140A013E|nr:HAD family hydrolase [Paenibacillus turpanensis]